MLELRRTWGPHLYLSLGCWKFLSVGPMTVEFIKNGKVAMEPQALVASRIFEMHVCVAPSLQN
jgi:hypothetical protein